MLYTPPWAVLAQKSDSPLSFQDWIANPTPEQQSLLMALLLVFLGSVAIFILLRRMVRDVSRIRTGISERIEEDAALSVRRQALMKKELANREIEADHKSRILNTRDSAYLAEKRREEEEQRHLEELQAIKARLSRKG